MMQTLTVEVSSRRVATVLLNRPDRGNAFDQTMLDELRNQHVAQRRRCVCGCGGRMRPARGQIGAGAEMPAAAPQHHNAHCLVGAERGELIAQFVEHRLVEGIAAIGPIQEHRRDPAGRDFDRQRLHHLNSSPTTLIQPGIRS